MSGLPLTPILFHRTGARRFGVLDLLLILLGAGLAYWLLPGITEGAGF